MKTAEQRKTEFLNDLQRICSKHNCEMSLSDSGKPCGLHSPIIVLSFEGIYNDGGYVVEQSGDFELDGLCIASSGAEPL